MPLFPTTRSRIHHRLSRSNLARPELRLIGGGDARKRFCLSHEHQGDCDGHETHAGHAQQASRVAESKTQYAIRLNPRDPSIFFRYSGLSIAHFVLSDFEQSRKWAQLSIDRKPDWWAAHALLTASLMLTGRKNEAIEAAKALLQRAPKISLHTLPIEPVRPAAAKKLFYDSLSSAGVPLSEDAAAGTVRAVVLAVASIPRRT
jgi:tetratricopeptide (TPR) repeat protein